MVMPEILPAVLIAWGVVTAMLICVLIYRGTLSTHEEDQIFLNSMGNAMAREQQVLVARIQRLRRPIVALIVLSSALLAMAAGLWCWQGFRNF